MKGWILSALLISVSTVTFADEPHLHAYGYGPVLVGMSLQQAEKRLGVPLVSEQQSTDDPLECDFYAPVSGKPALHFMVAHNTILHVEVRTPEIATSEGVRVGDSSSKISAVYGYRVVKKPHAYSDGFYYFVWDINHQRGLKFEVEEGRIVAIYGGDDSNTLVEGCA